MKTTEDCLTDFENPTLDALITLLDVFESNDDFRRGDGGDDYCFELTQLTQLLHSPTIGYLVHIPAYIVDVWTILLGQAFPWLDDKREVASCLLRQINKYEILPITKFLFHYVVQRRRVLQQLQH